MMQTVLIIEDEPELVKVLRSYLEQAGFNVLSAHRGDTGFTLWEQKQPDLLILDLNLPGMDGLDVTRAIRRNKHGNTNTPIIMLTARVEETDQLIGLELGADDYILKPFSPRIVIARARALLRRVENSGDDSNVIRISDLEINLDAHTVTRSGQSIDLTPTEFNLLTTLARYPGRVYKRLQLLEAVQGIAYEGYERTIDAHIKNLRSKIETDPRNPRFIETVFGWGYKFNRDIE